MQILNDLKIYKFLDFSLDKKKKKRNHFHVFFFFGLLSAFHEPNTTIVLCKNQTQPKVNLQAYNRGSGQCNGSSHIKI